MEYLRKLTHSTWQEWLRRYQRTTSPDAQEAILRAAIAQIIKQEGETAYEVVIPARLLYDRYQAAGRGEEAATMVRLMLIHAQAYHHMSPEVWLEEIRAAAEDGHTQEALAACKTLIHYLLDPPADDVDVQVSALDLLEQLAAGSDDADAHALLQYCYRV